MLFSQWALDKSAGEIVKIDGVEFYYIKMEGNNPKVILKNRILTAFDTGTRNIFSPTETGNIGYYLNNTWFNTLSENIRSLVIPSIWYSGNETNETVRSSTVNVGLLRKSEFEVALKSRNKGGNLPHFTNDWELTITSYSANTGTQVSVWMVSNDGTLSYSNDYNNLKKQRIARPALVLRAGLYVDDNGNVSDNNVPTITTETAPSGTYATKPSFNYAVTDGDNHTMTITEKIDGIPFNTRTAVASGTTLTYTPSDSAWLRTRINQTVNIEITADDGNGGVTTVTYPFTRTTPAIDLALKTPFETDVAARRLLLQIEGNIPNDAIVSVQACNNAFDANPTWENATNLVLSGFPYPFANTVKTATKWGVSFKVRVERGSSTQEIYIDGLGGAFD